MSRITPIASTVLAATLVFAPTAQAHEVPAPIPTTISEAAQDFYASFPDIRAAGPMPGPEQTELWQFVQNRVAAQYDPLYGAALARFDVSVTEIELGDIPALDVRPDGWSDNGQVIVYTHGGGYTVQNTRTTLGAAAAVASATGLRVVSLDYTLAPQSQWENTLAEVTGAFQDLLGQGYAMDDIAIFGDSAGGGLAAGSVLKMRDDGMGLPGAIVLWSPWSDIDVTQGDTYATLEAVDPILWVDGMLRPMALAYADPEDFQHPYVSPVHGDYSEGFPPTLIQGGTREVFLSNFVRHYQAIDAGGQEVVLDLYEGMPHVFQYILPDAPEAARAVDETADFILTHLGG